MKIPIRLMGLVGLAAVLVYAALCVRYQITPIDSVVYRLDRLTGRVEVSMIGAEEWIPIGRKVSPKQQAQQFTQFGDPIDPPDE